MLNAVDQYVVSRGFGGAQFLRIENTYRLPIIANGKPGDLILDTGAPSSVIFKAAVKKFGLKETGTDIAVHGAFGKSREKLSVTTIQQLAMGNCTLTNVKQPSPPIPTAGDSTACMACLTGSSVCARCSNTTPSSTSPTSSCWSIPVAK